MCGKVAVETLRDLRGRSPGQRLAALCRATRRAIHASVTGARRMAQQITIVAARSPIVAKNDF
jgi:hypothetical protein